MRHSAQLSASVGRQWLREIVAAEMSHSSKYTKLFIFDFDGTLFRSPQPPEDRENQESWWSDSDSLGPPAVDTKPGAEMWHPDSVEALRKATEDPNAYVVVMTGRNKVLQDRIQKILDSAGLKPDELITNPKIGKTPSYKREEMKYLLRQLPRVREVEFWEDRKADLKTYQKDAEKQGMGFTPKLVKNYEDEAPPYVGVFLTPEAKRKLLKDFPPAHSGIQADHMTLLFKPNDEQMAELRDQFQMGQKVPIKITGIAQDEKAQALTVELPGDLQERSKGQAHITVSVAEGVSPLHSNELLQGGTRDLEPKVYEGYLDVGPRPGSPKSKDEPKKPSDLTEKQKMWLEFLQTKTRNPDFGKPGRHQEQVLRKTLYDAGGASRRQVMREWGPHIQRNRSR